MQILRSIRRSLGRNTDNLERVNTAGPEHALPAAFHVTELATSSIVAAALAAAELRELAGGAPSRCISVDRQHAVIAFRSERHITVDGQRPGALWDPASGYYETADGGLLQTHCNFPHHRSGLCSALGIPDPGDERVAEVLRSAIDRRGAQEMEDVLASRGLVASRLRTLDQWQQHPQSQATLALPVIELVRLGDAPPEALPAEYLKGIRVADLTRVIAGPVCGRTLAAYGADVLRVGAEHLPVIPGILADTNLGKRWTQLDLRTEKGSGDLRDLVRGSDVFLQGYRPGGLDALGFQAQALCKLRPGIVVASLSAYSHLGPWAERRGFDSLVQTATGIGAYGAQLAGQSGTMPLPAQALDHGAGWILAAGIMEALRRRATLGGSWLVRTSLLQVRNLLVARGTCDGLGVPDPGQGVDEWLRTVQGPPAVRHVAFPSRMEGCSAGWDRAGPNSPTDLPRWSARQG
jgi:crotonobetainyl-CoA:carnitine CoA-transferase CaiB-like acyl-CoA transferase